MKAFFVHPVTGRLEQREVPGEALIWHSYGQNVRYDLHRYRDVLILARSWEDAEDILVARRAEIDTILGP